MHSPSHASSFTSWSGDLEFNLNRRIQSEESSPESMLLLEKSKNVILLQSLEHAKRLDAEKSERIQELRQQLKDCRLQLRSESRSSWTLLRKIRQQLEAENARLLQSLRSSERNVVEMSDRNQELRRQAMEMEVQMRLERESATELLQNARICHEEETARLLQKLKEDDILIQQMSKEALKGSISAPPQFTTESDTSPSSTTTTTTTGMPSPDINPTERRMSIAMAMAMAVPYPDDSGAKPSMLQTAADAVNTAIANCADSILKFIRTRSLTPDMYAKLNAPAVADPAVLYRLYLNLEELSKLSINGSAQPLHQTHLKFAVQAHLCSGFMERFEDYDWGVLYNDNNNKNNNGFSSGNSTPQHPLYSSRFNVVDPKQAFRIYLRCVKLNNSKKLVEKEDDFRQVYQEYFIPRILLGSRLLRQHDPSMHMHDALESDSDVKNSFRKLASTMWMLQKIAFSFVPMARMLTEIGPHYNGDLMVSISDGNKIKDKVGGDNKSVRFLCVPGFTVRNNIVIKARVVVS